MAIVIGHIARHYICAYEPVEKLTHKKIKTYILKPLMYPLRLERYCTVGIYPQSNNDLLKAYENHGVHELIEHFLNEEKYNNEIKKDHREVLSKMQSLVSELI